MDFGMASLNFALGDNVYEMASLCIFDLISHKEEVTGACYSCFRRNPPRVHFYHLIYLVQIKQLGWASLFNRESYIRLPNFLKLNPFLKPDQLFKYYSLTCAGFSKFFTQCRKYLANTLTEAVVLLSKTKLINKFVYVLLCSTYILPSFPWSYPPHTKSHYNSFPHFFTNAEQSRKLTLRK